MSVRKLSEAQKTELADRLADRPVAWASGAEQALNHANHHREQVCAILTGLGIQPPDIQAWEYAWTTGRIWDR